LLATVWNLHSISLRHLRFAAMNVTVDNSMKTTYGEKLKYARDFLERRDIRYTEYKTLNANLNTLDKKVKTSLAYQFALSNPTNKSTIDHIGNQYRICVLYPQKVIDLLMYVAC